MLHRCQVVRAYVPYVRKESGETFALCQKLYLDYEGRRFNHVVQLASGVTDPVSVVKEACEVFKIKSRS